MTQNLQKFIFGLMASCMLLPAQAQDVPWFEPDHEWFYSNTCNTPVPCGYQHFTVDGSAEIGGYEASAVTISRYDGSGILTDTFSHYFRTSGDSVFHYYEPSEIWYLLYSFNTPVGETWVVQEDVYVGYGIEEDLENWHFIVRVDSIETMEINGLSRRVVYASSIYGTFFFEHGIIEGIGAVGQTFFFDATSILLFYGTFSCFIEDDEIVYGPFGYPCQPVSTENSVLNNLEIFPNPASDRFSISLPENSPSHFEVRMYDLSGRVVHTELNYKADQMMNLRGFSPGLYILQVRSGEGLYSGKLVVE